MSEHAVNTNANLPLGARGRRRKAVPVRSYDLAEQLALRGASESLVRAVGGDEAVEKLMGDKGSTDASSEASTGA